MRGLEKAKLLVAQENPKLEELDAILKCNLLTKQELMEIAIHAAEFYKFFEADKAYREVNKDDNDWYIRIYKKYDKKYIEEVGSHALVQIIRILLDNGLDPNAYAKGETMNVFGALRYVDQPFLAAACMRLLLEAGADPFMKINDAGECFFVELDSDICTDIGLCPDDMVQSWVQCWFVLIGYGARPEKMAPFQLDLGHSYDELKNFEYYDWVIQFDQEKKKNVMHIIDIRTGEEIGTL